jgi:tetratricopeptide (TPR) repeat protein
MQALVAAGPSKNVNASHMLERYGSWPRLILPAEPSDDDAGSEERLEEAGGGARPLTPPPPLLIDYQDSSQVNSDVAAALCGVGCRSSQLKEHDRAISCFARALEIELDQAAPAADNMILYFSNIAVSLENMAEYERSLEFSFRALHMALECYGPRSLEACYACEGIGQTYLAKGQHNLSSQWMQRSFDILVQLYGIDHEQTARGLSQLGLLCRPPHAAASERSAARLTRVHAGTRAALSFRKQYMSTCVLWAFGCRRRA